MPGNIHQISYNTRALLGGETWDDYEDPHRVLTVILAGLKNAGFRRKEALQFFQSRLKSRRLWNLKGSFPHHALTI